MLFALCVCDIYFCDTVNIRNQFYLQSPSLFPSQANAIAPNLVVLIIAFKDVAFKEYGEWLTLSVSDDTLRLHFDKRMT